MSPRVSIEINADALVELHKPTRTRAAEALAAARARGISLRPGELGVVAGLADWHVDHHLQPPGVSLAGAVLLHLQPEPRDAAEALEAAAEALGVSLAWVEGAEAGWSRELMDVRRLAALDAQLYRDGHAAGLALQAEIGYGRR